MRKKDHWCVHNSNPLKLGFAHDVRSPKHQWGMSGVESPTSDLQDKTRGLNRLPTTKVPHEVVTISTIVTQVFSLNLSLKFVQRVSLVTRIPVWDPLRAVEMSWPMFSHTNKNKREKILWPINWALLNSFVLGYIVLLLL